MRQQNVKRRSRAAGAIVVPVHMAFQRIGLAAFISRSDEPDIPERFDAHADILALLAHRFISSYVKTRCASEPIRKMSALTDREAECVSWAAHGKTDDEIAVILDRSRSTIRFHMNNAADKLGTARRGQTIFRAMQLGYVEQ